MSELRHRLLGEAPSQTDSAAPGAAPGLFDKLRPKGKLIKPGDFTGKNVRLCLSPVDEHFFSTGATPADGAGFFVFLQRGPCSWWMFVSCISFALPGFIHAWKCEHMADILAAIALVVVAMTSTLCDSLCVDSTVYDESPYERTAYALGAKPVDVAQAIKNHNAGAEVLANDGWNNLTRAIDRFWAAGITFPLVFYYMYVQRPSIRMNIPFVIGLAIAWLVCLVGQHFRKKDPCGVRYIKGTYIVETNYQVFMVFHELWHFLLVATLIASALYRPMLAP